MSSELSYIKSYYLLLTTYHIPRKVFVSFVCDKKRHTPCKIRVIDLRDLRFVRFVFSPKYSAPPLRVKVKE